MKMHQNFEIFYFADLYANAIELLLQNILEFETFTELHDYNFFWTQDYK